MGLNPLTKKAKQQIEVTIKCPECGNTHLSKDYSRAELVCEQCGLVIDEALIDYKRISHFRGATTPY